MTKKRHNKLEVRSRMVKRRGAPKDAPKEKRWFWRLISAYNGEIICAGQPRGYARKAVALAGWSAVAASADHGVEVVEKG